MAINKKKLIYVSIYFFKIISNINAQDALAQKIRIGYCSSWDIQCGIAIYTKHLVEALKKKEYEVFVYRPSLSANQIFKQAVKDRINILNIQWEPGLWTSWSLDPNDDNKSDKNLHTLAQQLHKQGIKIIVTVHYEDKRLEQLASFADQFIYHKPARLHYDGKINQIPMGVPVFELPTIRNKYRSKYGFDKNHVILSTFGFMSPWKEYNVLLEALVPWLRLNPNHRVQLLTAINALNPTTGFIEKEKVLNVINNHNIKNQVILITDFIEQNEINERLWISTLGYLWCNIVSFSTSAASKEFISSRLPVIATDCSHYHDLKTGVIKTSADKAKFVQTIESNISDAKKLYNLRKQLNAAYNELNNNAIIKKHIQVFEKALYESTSDTNTFYFYDDSLMRRNYLDYNCTNATLSNYNCTNSTSEEIQYLPESRYHLITMLATLLIFGSILSNLCFNLLAI